MALRDVHRGESDVLRDMLEVRCIFTGTKCSYAGSTSIARCRRSLCVGITNRPTRRQSQRRDLSRIVLAHAPRQLPSWLIFDVGHKI